MKRLTLVALALLLVLTVVPVQFQARASTTLKVDAKSVYSLNRYGFAVLNETVVFFNNSTSPATAPSLQVGIGNISTLAVSSVLEGDAFSMSPGPTGGPFNVSAIQSVPADGNASFTISVLLNGTTTSESNGNLRVLTLSSPALSVEVAQLEDVVSLPGSSSFTSAPAGLGATIANEMYTATLHNLQPSAVTSVEVMKPTSSSGFNPLDVFQAKRTISIGSGGVPIVTDYFSFENLGGTGLTTLYISPLTPKDSTVTIIPPSETKLINPVKVTLSGDSISLSSLSFGSPSAGGSYTIAFQYALSKSYYSISGGQVTLNIPDTPPIPAFVSSYTIRISVSPGVRVVEAGPQAPLSVTPWQKGTTTMEYAITAGWAVTAGIPSALIVFGMLFIVLFVSKGSMSVEEEEEEETYTEAASAMIKVFDEKTNLIDGLWSEITSTDPNQLSKALFDEFRGRLDDFRSKALRRLNELKQKSTTQKFFDLLTQVTETEREVDRASKDKLNLYEQFYTKRMRKEVFDRLLPQYTKRLEKALNQLSDELHVIQKEAKVL